MERPDGNVVRYPAAVMDEGSSEISITWPSRPGSGGLPPSRVRRMVAWLRLHLPFLLILGLALYFLTINVQMPWATEHEDNGLFFESVAISHIRYGLGVTKGQDYPAWEVYNAKQVDGMFTPAGQLPGDQFTFFYTGPIHPVVYGDHPPLLGLSVAGSLLIFGPHFWAVRLVPLLYAVATLILFYFLACTVFDVGVARLAAFLLATFPMFAYFGRMVDHEAPALFWATLLLTAYVLFRKSGRRRWLFLAALAIFIGGFYAWPLFYFAYILFAVDWAGRRRPHWPTALATVGVATVTFLLVIAQLLWALDGNVAHLMATFLFRTGTGPGPGTDTTAAAWLNAVVGWNTVGFGTWSQLLLPVVVVFIAQRGQVEGLSLRVQLLLVAALWGISHVIIFSDGAYFHDYWQYYFLPFYAMGFAWFGTWLVREQLSRPALRTIAVVVAGFVVLCLNIPTIYQLFDSAGTFSTLLHL